MRTRNVARWSKAIGVAVTAAAMLTAGALQASAASPIYAGSPVLGTLVGTANPSATNLPQSVKTSAACPAGTDNVAGYLDSTASAGWSGIQAVDPQSFTAMTTNGLVMNNNLIQVAAANALSLANGHYDLAVVCYSDPNSIIGVGQFDGGFTLNGTVVTWDATGPAATTTTIAALPVGSATAGSAVQLTATVTPAVAGTVQFIDGPDGSTVNVGSPATVTAGKATSSTSTLAVGTHSLRAVFTPADTTAYAASTSLALSYTVTAVQQPPAATTTTIAASPAGTAQQGAPVTFTATVVPAAAGTVQFLDGPDGAAVNLGSPVTVTGGTATLNTSALSVGSHLVRASFTPADTTAYAASTSQALTYTVTAVQQPPTTTTTTITANPATSAQAASDVTFTATVSPAAAAGQVQFIDGPDGSTANVDSPVTVSGGKASLTISSLTVGSHNLRAVFTPTGAAAFTTSTSTPLVYQITPAPQGPTSTTTSLSAAPAGTAKAGTPVTFTARVGPSGAAGSVTFTDTANGNSTPIGDPVPVTSGVAAVSTSALAEGSHQLTAAFTPDDPAQYVPSQSAALTYTITVAGGTTARTTRLSLRVDLVRCFEERCCWNEDHHGRQPARTALLFAEVHPGRAVGTVQIFETVKGVTTPIGGPITLTHGVAFTSVSGLADGAHVFTAAFTATDPAAFTGSTSRPVRVQVGRH